MKSTRILNLGSGQRRVIGAINIDFNKSSKPDVVHDLNSFPYPFRTGAFSRVYCFDVLEHLDNLIAVMSELHRICEDGACVSIEAPHFSSVNAYADPTHRHCFSIFSFDYFTGENQWGYYLENKFRYKTLRRKIIFQKTILRKLFEFVFNRHPKYYESRLAWILPAEKIIVDLKVVKER